MAPSLVQTASATGTTGTTVTATFASPVTAGNCLVACMGTAKVPSAAAPTITGVTIGGAADNWARAKAQAETSSGIAATDTEIWTDQGCAGGGQAVAMALSAAPTDSFIWAEEWSGVAASGAVDKTNSAGATTGSWSSGSSGTLSQASEVVVACVTCATGAATTITGPGSPWTNLAQLGSGISSALLAGYQVVSATTAQTYSGTQTATSFECNGAVIVTLLAAAAGGPVTSVLGTAMAPMKLALAGSAASGSNVTGTFGVAMAAMKLALAGGVPLSRQLLISLASKAGTDDYGNSFPQGILATAGIIEGPVFEGSDFIINQAGMFFYSATPAAGNLIMSLSNSLAGGVDGFGNKYVFGLCLYDNSGGFITQVGQGFVAFGTGSLSGGWTGNGSIQNDSSGNLYLGALGSIYANGNLIS